MASEILPPFEVVESASFEVATTVSFEGNSAGREAAVTERLKTVARAVFRVVGIVSCKAVEEPAFSVGNETHYEY